LVLSHSVRRCHRGMHPVGVEACSGVGAGIGGCTMRVPGFGRATNVWTFQKVRVVGRVPGALLADGGGWRVGELRPGWLAASLLQPDWMAEVVGIVPGRTGLLRAGGDEGGDGAAPGAGTAGRVGCAGGPCVRGDSRLGGQAGRVGADHPAGRGHPGRAASSAWDTSESQRGRWGGGPAPAPEPGTGGGGRQKTSLADGLGAAHLWG
jgi:hypothetical protein